MNTKDLMKIAKAVYPDKIVEIESEEVWFMSYPSTLYFDCERKILATRFNPEEDFEQLYDCEEWLLEKEYILTSGKSRNNIYNVAVSRTENDDFVGQGKARAGAILNALLEVIENDK